MTTPAVATTFVGNESLSVNNIQSLNPRTGAPIGKPIPVTTPEQLDATILSAAKAADIWAGSTGVQRALLLRSLAKALEADREPLVALADEETALGTARLGGEIDRTAFQLQRFADIAQRGAPFSVFDDPAVSSAPPTGHPPMQRWLVGLGPVAMFSASNFPFAFSVLGGDTASALAAGCPVVVKAHSGHPLLSQLMFGLVQRVLTEQGLPAGLLGMVQGVGNELGLALVRHPLIAAAAFTGSTGGGIALQAEANSRPRPIPFYGELGSINPVIVLPAALAERATELATTLAGSITLGCGQFCTKPGLIVLIDTVDAVANNDAFVNGLREKLAEKRPHAMLTPGMRRALDAGVLHWAEQDTELLLNGTVHELEPRPTLAQTNAAQFLARPRLREEVFGPASLVVRAASVAQVLQVLHAVSGSLTVTLLGAEDDNRDNRALVRGAMAIAGRVLFAGVPTGVAVTGAQHHGGPWPASTNALVTSVGDAALWRFLRPVALQDAPPWVLAQKGVTP